MPPLRHRFHTYEFGELDVHVRTLRDRNQFDAGDHDESIPGLSSSNWPLFGVVWDCSLVLAEIMNTFDTRDLRILEVGCGIGIASLVLSSGKADITATDQHPLAESFLDFNADLNGFDRVCFVRADWSKNTSALGRFDLVIGSDLLYEQDNAALLGDFIESRAAPTSRVIIVDPGRGQTARFKARMATHGFACNAIEPERSRNTDTRKIHVMRFSRSNAAA